MRGGPTEASRGILGRVGRLYDNVSGVEVDVIMGDKGGGNKATTLGSTS